MANCLNSTTNQPYCRDAIWDDYPIYTKIHFTIEWLYSIIPKLHHVKDHYDRKSNQPGPHNTGTVECGLCPMCCVAWPTPWATHATIPPSWQYGLHSFLDCSASHHLGTSGNILNATCGTYFDYLQKNWIDDCPPNTTTHWQLLTIVVINSSILSAKH